MQSCDEIKCFYFVEFPFARDNNKCSTCNKPQRKIVWPIHCREYFIDKDSEDGKVKICEICEAKTYCRNCFKKLYNVHKTENVDGTRWLKTTHLTVSKKLNPWRNAKNPNKKI